MAIRLIIMIGAGTGIAPYRAFVEERVANRIEGQELALLRRAQLHQRFPLSARVAGFSGIRRSFRIDVAFSRDQPEKIYVQHRLWERRAELQKWLQDGAHLYVCGDEKGMAKDVDATLVKILAELAKGDEEAGRAKLKELTKAGRYQRDVY